MLQWIATAISYFRKTAATLGVMLAAVFSFSGFLLVPLPAFAQTASSTVLPAPSSAAPTINNGLAVVQQPLGLAGTDIRLIISRIIRVALGLIGIVMVVLILYAGVLWMTAGGNEDQIANAKNIIKNASIGLGIILVAYSIVLFVMRLLGIGGSDTGAASNADLISQNAQSFIGSGALGGIVKDHYPGRDQVDIARNTKIIITFRKPIKVSSFVTNSNQSKDAAGNDVFGDCVNIGPQMNWKTDCDSLVLDDKHILIQRADTKQAITGASVLANYENGKVYTIVIRPHDYLGDSNNKVPYIVHLGDALRLDDAANNDPIIFDARLLGKAYYEWQFTCSTELDTDPPVVRSTFPAAGATEVKNTVIQIDFSEAMDPTGIQGDFAANGSIYSLQGNNVYLKADKSTVPLGSFHLTNGYRTLEFTSTKECGTNACGGKLYCLPVCDKGGANCDRDQYSLLLRAAQTFTATAFEAIPFSGVMDVSGNGLDGNKDRAVQTAPVAGDIFTDQNKPDNFAWNFVITSQIDLTAPYLERITPGIDAEFVTPDNVWSMLFSKRMRVEPMYDIGLEQYPNNFPPLCRVPRVDFNDDGSTLTAMNHCPFAKNINQFYAPLLNSNIEDVHYNCFYPGKGPGGAEEVRKRLKTSSVCAPDDKNCCPTSGAVAGKSYCCNGTVVPSVTTEAQCLTYLKKINQP